MKVYAVPCGGVNGQSSQFGQAGVPQHAAVTQARLAHVQGLAGLVGQVPVEGRPVDTEVGYSCVIYRHTCNTITFNTTISFWKMQKKKLKMILIVLYSKDFKTFFRSDQRIYS